MPGIAVEALSVAGGLLRAGPGVVGAAGCWGDAGRRHARRPPNPSLWAAARTRGISTCMKAHGRAAAGGDSARGRRPGGSHGTGTFRWEPRVPRPRCPSAQAALPSTRAVRGVPSAGRSGGALPPPGGARVSFAFCGGRVTSPLPLWRPYLTFSPSPAPRSPLPSWRLQTQCPQWGGARVLTRANSPVSSQVHRSDSVLCPSPRHVPLAAAGGAQLPARCAPCGLCSLLPAVRHWGPQRCTRGDL